MCKSTPDSPEPVQAAAAVPPRRLLPGPWTCAIVAICLALAVGLRLAKSTLNLARADLNVATVVLGAVAVVTLLVWFVWRSGYSVVIRRTILWTTLAALALLAAVFRIQHVSGDLVPRFAFRWQADVDQTLGQPEPAGDVVDLVTTTEHDFPQFLGPNRDAILPDRTLDSDWETKPPRLLWRSEIGAGWSGFSAVNGYAVTMEQRGDSELVTCYEIATGDIKWFHAITTRHQTLMGGVGPRSTPTIFAGKVYALGATGVLRCLDGATGNLLWHDDIVTGRLGITPAEDLKGIAWGRSASPLIVDDLVVVPWGGPAGGRCVSLAAYEKDTGSMVWTAGDYQASYSSPTLATLAGVRQILCINQDFLTSHDPQTGAVLWEFPWPGGSTTNASVSQPVPLPDDRVLLSKGYGIAAKLLKVRRTQEGTWRIEKLWESNRSLQTKFNNVVVRDGFAYALSDGILGCVDLSDGERKWRGGRYGQGQVLGIGDRLLVQDETGEIACVAARPDDYEELAVFPALDGKTWNNPCLYGLYLLVRNAEQAACYELGVRAR